MLLTGHAAAQTQVVAATPAAESEPSREPKPAEPAEPVRTTFAVDPVVDTAVIGVSASLAFVLDQFKGTGEMRPQPIPPDFDRDDLFAIDQVAVEIEHRPSARTWSNVGVNAAMAYAVLDSVLSGYRQQSVQTGLVDFVLYAESLAITQALANVVKYAVRRPRPAAYAELERHRDDPDYTNTNTDSALSFFSGHAATSATLGATATYLAFARSPASWRPWVTLVGATGVTTFVSVQRVRAGEHFPSDVIVGALVGAGVGVMVPHLHRTEDAQQRPLWVGYAPLERGGHGLTLSGNF